MFGAGFYSCLYTVCFLWFHFTTLTLNVKIIIFELYSKRSLTDSLGLISRTQPERLSSQVELVLVCDILAEALLGNYKATYRGPWKYR